MEHGGGSIVPSCFHLSGKWESSPASADPVRFKLGEILEGLSDREAASRGRRYLWLTRVLELAPEDSEDLFVEFLAPGTVDRIRTLCRKLRSTSPTP